MLWNCEIEPFCRRVLAKHWPSARQYENVKEINHQVEVPDLICGGFPCTDLSVAGTRQGLAGERSGLWHEYARILRVLRPKYVFIENVPALRHFVSEGLGRVLGDLTQIGYDVEWDCVPAVSVGAPHVRDRIFILGWQRDLADVATDDTPRGPERFDFPPPPNSPSWDEWLQRHPGAQPGLRRGDEESPKKRATTRRRRLKALGNAVVPQAAQLAWELLFRRAQEHL